eukprot:TCONS_00063677-protein
MKDFEIEGKFHGITKSISENKLNIVLDNSGSMYQYVNVARRFVLSLVHYLFQSNNYAEFNVSCFTKKDSSFSESLLPCTKQNILLLSRWLDRLTFENKTNSLLALVSAFSQEDSDGVVLLTDGPPSEKGSIVEKCVEEICDGRPLHVVYVKDGIQDQNAAHFWQNLSEKTYGTFHVVQYTKKEEELQVIRHHGLPENSSLDRAFGGSNRPGTAGQTLLAKSAKDGAFYQRKLEQVISDEALDVLLEPSPVEISGKKLSKITDLFSFDEENVGKVCEGDKVLAHWQDGKFIPATVLKKKYIYDEENEDLDFIKVVQVQSFDHQTKTLPLQSVLRIEESKWKTIVRDMIRKQIDKADENIDKLEESKLQLFKSKSFHPSNPLSLVESDGERDYLTETIERQLAESSAFMKSLTLNSDIGFDYAESSTTSTFPYETPKMQHHQLSQSLNMPKQNKIFGKECILNRSLNSFQSPTPPNKVKTWSNDFDNTKKKHRYQRSASVGSNVVERSKKHWVGRPITRETTPKPMLDGNLYRGIKSKRNPPSASDYQTADGVPFPKKTDKKFQPPIANNYLMEKPPPYYHRDIIAHRTIDMSEKPFSEQIGHVDKQREAVEEKRIKALRASTKRRLKRMEEHKETVKDEQRQRDEQARAAKQQNVEDGYTKIKITIEKNRSAMDNKKQKLEYWRDFESSREAKNQKKKFDRIDARKAKRQDYPQLKDEMKQENGPTPNGREEKRNQFKDNRLQNEITKQEAKLERLRKMRQATDARFDSMRKKNDYYRDMNEHVKKLNTGRKRAEILP